MKENFLYLLFYGVCLGSTACALSCGPFLASYTILRCQKPFESIFAYAFFSSMRTLAYIILAVLMKIGIDLVQSAWPVARIFFGVLLIVIGLTACIFVVWRKDQHNTCPAPAITGAQLKYKDIAVAGLLQGFMPCLPLVGILQYIALVAPDLFYAGLMAFVFGVATSVSFLLLALPLISVLAGLFRKHPVLNFALQIFCAMFLVFLGVRFVF